MPLEFQTIPVTIGALDQKRSPIVRGSGSLDSAINVEFDKDGALNKRRGYAIVDPRDCVGQTTPDTVIMAATTHRDELVLFTYDSVFGLGSSTATLRGEDAFVYRGPTARGNVRMEFVSQSRVSDLYNETQDPEG